MNTAQIISTIETTLTLRGSGTSPHSPVRVLRQYWSQTGELLAEVDPAAKVLTPEIQHELLEILADAKTTDPMSIIDKRMRDFLNNLERVH
jgi:hypothetical protein